MQEKGKEKTIYADQIEGRNSVLELLESGKDINIKYKLEWYRSGHNEAHSKCVSSE